MTQKEKAKQLRKIAEWLGNIAPTGNQSDFLFELAEDLEKEQWVSVKDRLPKDGQQVWICDDGGNQDICWYEFVGGFRYDFDYKVTHWRELPSNP